MEFVFSERAEHFGLNIFAELLEKKDERIKAGKPVYDMFVGTPDFKPAPYVMKAVSEAALDPDNYKYAIRDSAELIQAVQAWYARRYNVTLRPDEIMSLNGTQEGFAHIAWTVCEPGDIVLTPNPGYPIFSDGPYLCGAKVVNYDLDPDNHYAPLLEKIPEDTARKAKMIVVSYPLNPTCTCADRESYENLIRFARKYNILVVHDNAYSEIEYDGRRGFSFLSLPGAMDVGVEFNSLSKTYNLTGLRISFVLGNPAVIAKFRVIRSQFDYGMCLLQQKAAVAALTGSQAEVRRQEMAYQERRDALCSTLTAGGWKVTGSEGTMFVWAPIPKGFKDDREFCFAMLRETGVLCTPGSAFGSLGKNHVRFALVLPAEKTKWCASQITSWLASRKK